MYKTKKSPYGRYREILGVLIRHGFGWKLSEIHVGKQAPLNTRLTGARPKTPQTQAKQLRLAFEELGPTFIKLGQVLSTRSDMLPPVFIDELAKLQDGAPPIPYAQVKTVITESLGATPETLFHTFDPTPLASASIGQVHAATLHSGQEVVVKVQRPGVAELIERDLDVLTDLADKLHRYTSFGEAYDVKTLTQEFAFNIRCELDYLREGQNAEQFRRAFSGQAYIHVPHIYWDYTTERVLVMERLQGIKIDHLEAIQQAGIDPRQLAANSVRMLLESLFAHGFFHADPHPGNLMVLSDGVIGVIDFGMMGRMDEHMQDSLTRLLIALGKGDSMRVIDEMAIMGMMSDQVNQRALKQDVAHLIVCYTNQSVQDLAASNVFSELTDLARRHRLRLPSELVLMTKAMAISEGLSLKLDPEFIFVRFAQPYLQQYWFQRRSPRKIGEKVAEGLVELADFSLSFPKRLTRIASQIERGELGGKVEIRGLDANMNRVQGMVHQLSASILVGALIVGLSQFMHMVAPDGFSQAFAGRFFGFLFVIAVFAGFWLLFSILRGK